MILMACTYIGGALIYALRFPERLNPGMFNYFVSYTKDQTIGNMRLIRYQFYRVLLIKFSMSVLS